MSRDETAGALERGRAAFERMAWAEAVTELSAADRETPLAPSELERLAFAMYLAGRDDESVDLFTRAHRAFLTNGDPARAARSAFWVAFQLFNRGDMAQGGGWIARARRLLDDHALDGVERGYLILPDALAAGARGDQAAAQAAFARAAETGARFADPDLVMLARQGQGRALIRQGDADRGLALLDEVMVAVTAGEVSPLVAGVVYCSVLGACHDVFDLRRAREWTDALSRWCAAQPDLVPFRGQCLIHRAEILQLRGTWSEAMREARQACECLSEPRGQQGAGAAFYQQAELHRLRGELHEAEDAYRQASQLGRSPYPGLALLRLAQDDIPAAAAAIRRVLDEPADRRLRARLLPAAVEIAIAAGDVPAAHAAADELRSIASELRAPFLRAVSAHSTGAVCLVEGDARAALSVLRQAWTLWQELEAPYEAARVRVLVALACKALNDHDAASMEMDAARHAFRELGAAADLARLEETGSRPPRPAGGLTPREIEVLRLVAAGRTNRSIATALSLSEKTVARHVSNIFTKLGLSTRAAATAYAYQHGLVD